MSKVGRRPLIRSHLPCIGLQQYDGKAHIQRRRGVGVEGLWTISYGSVVDPMPVDGWSNAGIIVFESQRLFGSDSQYFYTRTYETTGNVLKAKLDIQHFNGPRSTAFGTQDDRFTIHVLGNIADKTIFRADADG